MPVPTDCRTGICSSQRRQDHSCVEVDLMRSPFEIVILVACALTGLIGLLTGNASPASISVAFAGWAAIWNIGVLVGGVGTLVALWCKAPLNYLLERVGMVWLTTLFLAYAVAIGVVND